MNKKSLVGLSMVGAFALVLSAGSVVAQDLKPANTTGDSSIYLPVVIGGTRETGTPISGQYIVVFNDFMLEGTAQASADIASSLGGTVLYTYTSALQGFVIKLPVTSTAQSEFQTNSALTTLANDPRVDFIEQDRLESLDDTSSVGTAQPNATWGLDRIDQRSLPLDSTFNYFANGSNVHVYVIDSGIRLTHGEFGGRAVLGFDAINDGNADCLGHGTHVAGTIGGATYGVAKGTQLVSVRVFGCNGTTATSNIIRGVDWVTQNRVLPAVTNMSLGGTSSDALDRAVRRSIQAGITYVIAAGNESIDACTRSPARVPEAITVGATDRTDRRSDFSNIGSCVDVFAPGSGITSAWISSDTAIAVLSGTSMATPHVAGAAAIYLQNHPNASPADVAQVVVSNSTPDVISNVGSNSPNRLLYTLPLEDCAVVSEGVYLYEHAYYQGRCTKFTADSSEPSTWSIGNDTASSIYFIGKWTAEVFQHADFQGASTTYDADDPYLGDDSVGNDTASSIRVRQETNCDGGEGVYLYENVSYGGRCTKLTADAASPFSWYVGNDAVSSVRLVGKWTTTVYQDANYAGTSSTFTGDDPDLGDDAIRNDTISSVRVQRLSNCDGGEGVYLYEHENYQGRCSKFTADSGEPFLWFIGNDTATSVRFVGKWTAVIYEHANFGGASSKFVADNPNFSDQTIGNDRASSIRVQRVTECDGGEGVYLYEHINYEGRCSKFTTDSSDPALWYVGNDAASSIRIIGSWTATVYQHANFQGAATTYTSDDPDIGNETIGNDRASSIRVQRQTVIDQWSP